MERGIELVQRTLWRANWDEYSVYQNGDRLISSMSKTDKAKYVKKGVICIPENELLLVSDFGEEEAVFGATNVFNELEDCYVLSDANIYTQEELDELDNFFKSKNVDTSSWYEWMLQVVSP